MAKGARRQLVIPMGGVKPTRLDETPGRTMRENFQWDREGRRKGIVLLRLPLGV